MKELDQLVYHKVMEGHDAKQLTTVQKQAALHYLMFLKQKQCGWVKGHGCPGGQKQRVYKTKEETHALTISTESLFLMMSLGHSCKLKLINFSISNLWGRLLSCLL